MAITCRASTSTLNALKPAHRSISYSAQKAQPFVLSSQKPISSDEHENQKSSGKLRMLMFGKPGAGKGTLTSRLVRRYDIATLSTGDLLRQHIAEKTEVGREAEDIVARGGLIPDETILKVVTSKLDSLMNRHWILDGFPRTLIQGQLLDKHLRARNAPLTLVVNIDVPDNVILERISDRWVHLPSGRVYNMSYNPPQVEGRDDLTGEPLTKRPDDNPETFARRLQQFYASTSPLVDYYAAQSAASIRTAPSPHQHPHQLSIDKDKRRFRLETLSGATSDENWPVLENIIRTQFPSLTERADLAALRRNHKLPSAAIQKELEKQRMGKISLADLRS